MFFKHPKLNTHRQYIINFALSIFIILAAWGTSDIWLSHSDSNVGIHTMKFEKGVGFVFRGGYQKYATYINSLGFRNNELPDPVSEEIRILALGDSVTFGTFLKNGEDWPARLQEHLRKQGAPATVINGGVPGATSNQLHKLLKHYYNLIKPDIVLVQNTGNMLIHAKNNLDWFDKIGIKKTGNHIFPHNSEKNFIPASDCHEWEPSKNPMGRALNVPFSIPETLKYLSSHSPSAKLVTSHLSSIYPNLLTNNMLTNSSKKISSNSKCYLEGPIVFQSEMLHMGLMIQFAKNNNFPIVFLKPSFAYNWGSTVGDKFPLTREAYKIDPALAWRILRGIENIFSFFKKNSKALLINPIDKSKLDQLDATELYLDNSHYSIIGAKFFAETIGKELISKRIILPIQKEKWLHPSKKGSTSYNFLSKDIPDSISYTNVLLVGITLTLIISLIGFSIQFVSRTNLNNISARFAPITGFFILIFGGTLVKSFSIDPINFFALLILSSLIIISIFSFHNRKIISTVLKTATLSIVVSILAASIILSVLQTPLFEDPGRVRDLQQEIAWVELLSLPKEYQILGHENFCRGEEDYFTCPAYILGLAITYSNILYPVSPILPASISNILGFQPQDAVFGVFASFTAAFTLAFLFLITSIKPKIPLVGIGTFFIAAAGGVFYKITNFPTTLLMSVTTGALICLIAIFSDENSLGHTKLPLLFAGGGVFYFLPVKLFVITILSVGFISIFHNYLKSKCVWKSFRLGIFAIIVMASSRVLLLNITVANPELFNILKKMNFLRYFF